MGSRHVLIAGVGYRFLRDMSVGPAILPLLQDLDWPEGVEIDDWSFGPIAIVQRLEDRPDHYDRIILVSAVERGRPPGTVTCYRWNGNLPDDEEVQERVAEAVTGVISLDNLLIITQRFGVLPKEVFVVEIEPEDTNWGPDFTTTVEEAMSAAVTNVRRLALEGYHGFSH